MASRDEVAYRQSLGDELTDIEQVGDYLDKQTQRRDLNYQFVADYRKLIDDCRQFGQAFASFSTEMVPVH